ncbi:YbaN family protein [bacterium]|nr:YbaN family protein [bacterium]
MRLLFLLAGYLSVGLGLIGALLPILPTTPFLVLAAACFSRSSPRLHEWLLKQPTVGPSLEQWETHGVIRLRAKIFATAMVVLSLSYPLLFKDFSVLLKGGILLVVSLVLSYIWTRPSQICSEKEE